MGSSKHKLGSNGPSAFEDEFGPYLEEANRDPEFRAAYEDELLRHKLIDSLVALRRTQGLTQSDVARRMNVRQPTISGFETESSDPRVSTLQRYARAVGARIVARVDMPADCDWVSVGAASYRRDISGVVNAPRSKVSGSDIGRRWYASSKAASDRSSWTLGA